MRDKLENLWQHRAVFTGRFVKFGIKADRKGSPVSTVLLSEIRDESGIYLCDHLWIEDAKDFYSLDLAAGDIIQFYGRVESYKKGYRGNRYIDVMSKKPMKWDYKITNVMGVKKIIPSYDDYADGYEM